jgi:hypothetical protein
MDSSWKPYFHLFFKVSWKYVMGSTVIIFDVMQQSGEIWHPNIWILIYLYQSLFYHLEVFGKSIHIKGRHSSSNLIMCSKANFPRTLIFRIELFVTCTNWCLRNGCSQNLVWYHLCISFTRLLLWKHRTNFASHRCIAILLTSVLLAANHSNWTCTHGFRILTALF